MYKYLRGRSQTSNYVDKILAFLTTCLPRLVNVVCERPQIPNSKILKGDFHAFFQVDHTYKLYYGGAQKRPDGNYVNIIRNIGGKHVAEVGQANRKGIFLCWQNIFLSAIFFFLEWQILLFARILNP